MKKIRSPLFYVGDKYKLMPQLSNLFPNNINTFYDVFAGGGSASINTFAKKHELNDLDQKIIELHLFLQKETQNLNVFLDKMYEIIKFYGLSHSEIKINSKINELKKEFKKTYFSKYNKEFYIKLREDYNENKNRNDLLYLLLIYGFNHMIRFNSQDKFNLPVGNVDWNKNVTSSLKNYSRWVNKSNISMFNLDFESFVNTRNPVKNDFFYFDPPYLISFSDYNKLWNEKEEFRLYSLLDDLNERGIKWGLSNMVQHKGQQNNILLEWAKKYNEYSIKSNYISRFDNSIKKNSIEVYITNFNGEKLIKEN
ncbi:DNA adenine methylase [Methanobrevibacter curvatus]|uniref:site-specific DNA-methyltransferase (adenine-specific) n=1 Tax=Methanobrevibacter curvatus TaxID=49547 RepID=A0A165ZF31_9EURY|nr:Dam family site-specific DNA-(adenine-N6)-methyltransferase [Methanobrevibacter curvatus]KZX10629.1 modification methylase FokI [Methanobrevibacter curvatus]